MPSGINITVSGVSQTVNALNNYSTQLADKIVILALRTGAKRLRSLLQAAAPINRTPSRFFPAGRLKKSIFFKVSKIHKRNVDGIIGVYVRAKEKGGRRYGIQKNAYYGRFVEDGYKSRGGNRIQGIKFIQRTELQHKADIERIVSRTIEIGATQLANRLGL